MPHVTIKHFPAELTPAQAQALSASVTSAVTEAFACPESVVSIDLQPVEAEMWTERVYKPEIVRRSSDLLKKPEY